MVESVPSRVDSVRTSLPVITLVDSAPMAVPQNIMESSACSVRIST